MLRHDIQRRALAALALALPLLAPAAARAWDSWCVMYDDNGAPVAELGEGRTCTPAEYAFGRLRGSTIGTTLTGEIRRESEHTTWYERAAREVAGLPDAALDTYSLTQFLSGADPARPIVGPFEQTSRTRLRSFAVGELAALPDFSFALWDWADGNASCPLDGGNPDTTHVCHQFAFPGHMGAVNANHFPPQADHFYAHYHRLALARARQCSFVREIWGDEAVSRFSHLIEECERESLAIEAVAQHFLHDAWSAGHTWQRWGSTELADYAPYPLGDDPLLMHVCGWMLFPDRDLCERELRASVAAGIAGLVHGSTLLTGYCDSMCCPDSFVGTARYRMLSEGGAPEPMVGDHYPSRTPPEQESTLLRCAGASIGAVYDALASEGDPVLGARRFSIDLPDPEGPECHSARAVNAAMADTLVSDVAALSETLAGYLREHPMLTVEVVRRAAGLLLAPALRLCWRNVGTALACVLIDVVTEGAQRVMSTAAVDLVRYQFHAAREALRAPDEVGVAEAPPALFGVERNSAYLPGTALHPQEWLASYQDPPLPWPEPSPLGPTPPPDGYEHAAILARTFHRAHAADLCPRTDLATLEALRANVAARGGQAACAACVEIAQRHVRLGCDPADASCSGGYDTSAEPFCHRFEPAAAESAYIYAEGETAALAAESWCGCGGRLVALTDAGIRTLSGSPLALDPGGAVSVGSLPRDGAVAPGRRLYVGTGNGSLSGFELSDGAPPRELDVNGALEGTRVSLAGADLRGLTVASSYGEDWLLFVDGARDQLHVMRIPGTSEASTALEPCAQLDVGQDPSRTNEGAWDVVVDRAGRQVFVSLRGFVSNPGNGIANFDLGEVVGRYAAEGTCTPPATITHIRHLVRAGYGAMSLSPDGRRLAVTARITSMCPDQVHEIRSSCTGSTCVPEYTPVDVQVGCDRLHVFDVVGRTWLSFDGAGGVSTRPLSYPYAVAWIDERHLAMGSFQFPLSGWPAGTFDPDFTAMPNSGAIRLVDVEAASFDAGPRAPRFSTYNVAVGGSLIGETVAYLSTEGAIYVGSLDGNLVRMPPPTEATWTVGDVDPFWEGADGDPETVLHGALGNWYGGCVYACSRPGGSCPRPCSESGGDPVQVISLGSGIRALITY